MNIKRIYPGAYASNTYIICDEKSKEGVMVDPGGNAEFLISEAEGINIRYIILTHAHFDHIGALEEIADKFGATVVIHELESHALTDPRYNLCNLVNLPLNKREADKTVKEGDSIKITK